MKPYSIDLSQKIFEAYKRGAGSPRMGADLFGVSVSFVEKLLIQFRSTGNLESKPHAEGTPSRIDAQSRQQLQKWLVEQPPILPLQN
jgi:transposase